MKANRADGSAARQRPQGRALAVAKPVVSEGGGVVVYGGTSVIFSRGMRSTGRRDAS